MIGPAPETLESQAHTDRKLRIGLLIPAFQLAAWADTVIRSIMASDEARIELVIFASEPRRVGAESSERSSLLNPEWKVDESKERTWLTRLWSVFSRRGGDQAPGGAGDERANQALRNAWRELVNEKAPDPDAFKATDCSGVLARIPQVKIERGGAATFSDTDQIREIKAYDLDVLVALGCEIRERELLRAARLGVWSFAHDQQDLRAGFPLAGTWEVLEQTPVTECILEMHTAESEKPIAVKKLSFATLPLSIAATRNELYWKSTSLLPRQLVELHRFGEESIGHSKAGSNGSKPGRKPPSETEVESLLQGLKIRSEKIKRQERLSWEQWILLFTFDHHTPADSLSESTRIMPAADRFWADPFAISKGDSYWIFFEEYLLNTGKGHIAAMQIGRNGTMESPIRVLDRPYHLSYPCLFDLNGTLYMVPESKQNRTVELYECISFPDEWKFRRTLLENIQAVDATVFRHQERWWMFANVAANPSLTAAWDELSLFFTDDPLDGEWIRHNRNPVVCDVQRARPAGRPFTADGVLYRAGQDCSRCYGYGIRLHEIVTLTPDDYVEREMTFIEPNWAMDLIGVHTLNSTAGLTVADALIRRPRIRK